MKTKIINKLNTEKYLWGESCSSFVLLNTPGLCVKQEMMPPGTREKLHFHNETTQLFYLLTGQATFYVADDKLLVNPNESIVVLPKQKHFIENNSPAFIEFLVISQPTVAADRVNVE